MTTAYSDFLTSKIKVAEKHGITIDRTLLHPSSKPHQVDIIEWSLELGAALIAADCGMGKTHMAIETLRMLHLHFGGKYLIVTELGASETFVHPDPEIGEGARLGVQLQYVTCQEEADASECDILVTNYERVRMGSFDFAKFTGIALDEGNYIKNMASETTNSLQTQLHVIRFKYIYTATPSPNETLELINYAHVLGICDRGQILTRFFQRNSVKAGELTLHPQHKEDFWLWVSSWMIAIEKPSDLGYSDEGYELPELKVFWHEVKLNKALEGSVDRDGQKALFLSTGGSLPDEAKLKRESIEVRIAKALDIIFGKGAMTTKHWIIWHHLEDERKALNGVLKFHKSYADIYGSLKYEEREKRVVAFSKGELQILSTKDSLTGVGCNFQKHCHLNVLLGVNHDFDALYQLYKRTHRPFAMGEPVELHIIYLPEEYHIVCNLKEKWEQHNEQRATMRDIVRKFGLDHSRQIEEKKRSFKVDRQVWRGNSYELVNNDCVYEFKNLPDNSVDMILTSIPFGNHYEYTDKYNDFGHNTSNDDFFKQMDFLVPELLRVLKPGRIAAIHTKNRIHYGSVTGLGFSVLHRFTHKTCDCFERNGFYTLGHHYIQTDVVAENNQTYRLTFGELQKDSTKMGAGIPEEIWIFRKAPSSNANAYADDPVTKNINEYSLAHWQADADCAWRSSGNRYLNPFELKWLSIDRLQKWWKKFSKEVIYDYDGHIELLQSLDAARKLSRTFTTLPMQSHTGWIWSDVNRMHGLNAQQRLRKKQNHICPMPFDEVNRLITLYSNPGELIADPFGGIGTTGVCAVKKGRRAFLTELNDVYANCGATYLKESEYKNTLPTLFDLLTDLNIDKQAS
jgi:DNA modification methylase